MNLIKKFKEITKRDVSIAGGKGASLGEMTNSGISVPDGFVIVSKAFDRFIEANDLNIEIDAILDTVNTEEIHTVDKASEKIKSLILNSKISDEVAEAILNEFDKLGSKFVAVRSSATSEDSATAAWAGQLETYLNTTKSQILENVKKCWASLFTPRAIFYRFEQKLRAQKVSVAVVVQKMVDSEKSGISFSVHPVTQDKNHILIEAGLGLGEAIVSGEVTPDSYVIDKEDLNIIDISVNKQKKALYRRKHGGNEWKKLTNSRGGMQFLDKKEIIKLAKTIAKIEKHYGFPVDVEWAQEKGKFYIVQSRPITTLRKELRKTKQKKEFFVLEEIPEVFPTPVYDFMEIKPTNDFLKKIILTKNKFTESLTTYEDSNCNLYLIEEDFVKLAKDTVNFYLYRPKQAEKLNRLIIKESKRFFAYGKELLRRIEKEENVTKLIALWFESCKHYAELHKFGWIHTLIDFKDNLFTKHLMDYLANKIGTKNINLNQAFVTLTIPISKKTNFAQERKDTIEIIKDVKKRGHKKAEQAKKDSSVMKRLKNHTKKYCWVGFGFVGPAWNEDYFLKNLIEDLNKVEKEDSTEEEQAELVKNLEIDKQYQLLFKLARDLVEGKEFRKESMVHYYYVLDKLIYKIANKTGIKKEVLRFIYPKELLGLDLSAKYIKELEKRAKFHFNHITEKKDVIVSGENKKRHLKKFKFVELSISEDTLSGSIAYPGYAKGIAKIVNVKRDIEKIKKGEILISIATNPDLVPAMKKAAAIVTDVGGITSHAAIVSRELKIPCVIGTSLATKAIKDGDKIEVDAEKGVVRILGRRK